MSVTAERSQVLARAEARPAAPPALPPGTRPVDQRQVRSESAAGLFARTAFIIATLLALGYGWRLAASEEFIPKEGVGYWLGIIGGTALLVQLAYPLRKRARFMRRMGSAPAWFRVHMILGIVGPILILYHANYSLGATNSNVALITMIIVAVSGIIGRYVYGKIHNGLYGAHTNLYELLGDAVELLRIVEADVGGSGGAIAAKLTGFGSKVLEPRLSLGSNFANAFWLGLSVPLFRRGVLFDAGRAIRRNAVSLGWDRSDRRAHYRAAKLHITKYLQAVVKASELSFYERLFALWHIFHMPLFLLLIVTGIVHVVAVHLY